MRSILFLTLVVCFHCGKYSSFYTLFMGGGLKSYLIEINNPSIHFAILASLKRIFFLISVISISYYAQTWTIQVHFIVSGMYNFYHHIIDSFCIYIYISISTVYCSFHEHLKSTGRGPCVINKFQNSLYLLPNEFAQNQGENLCFH